MSWWLQCWVVKSKFNEVEVECCSGNWSSKPKFSVTMAWHDQLPMSKNHHFSIPLTTLDNRSSQVAEDVYSSYPQDVTSSITKIAKSLESVRNMSTNCHYASAHIPISLPSPRRT